MKYHFRGKNDAVSPVIAIILMVAITVVLASILYVWVMSMSDTEEKVEQFPTLEITLKDDPAGDSIDLKHVGGIPIDWNNYKMIITNQSSPSQTATMLNLPGELNAGENSTFNATNAPGFSDINYEFNLFYTVEIYNIDANKRVYNEQNILCEAT
ncbi:MAG: type IV pilin N-terminal domain-containing protein [Thermoplasmata archaeon]|nr:MAG: type IV pilin N-terminal domain-containing protein [Thermoplasmata archaeon]